MNHFLLCTFQESCIRKPPAVEKHLVYFISSQDDFSGCHYENGQDREGGQVHLIEGVASSLSEMGMTPLPFIVTNYMIIIIMLCFITQNSYEGGDRLK